MSLTMSAAARQASPVDRSSAATRAIAEAERIAVGLAARQAETERRTYYAEDTHEELMHAGLYRILVPRRFGGLELGVDTFMRVSVALARGCPSTGWMFLFGAAHGLVVATLFEEPAQAELFGDGHFICPAAVAPTGQATRTGNGQWTIDGSWAYCSGAPYATHFMGHAMVATEEGEPPRPLLFVVPRSGWRRLDDWGDQLGLRGSGSHSIQVENAVIPDRFTLPVHLSQLPESQETPGRALHDNPEYGGGQLSFMLLELGALAVGMAKGALDTYEELMRTRTTAFLPIVPRAEDPDYQFRYGEAAGLIDTAEAALYGAVRRWRERCQQAARFTREDDLRLALTSREVIRLAWRAVEGQLFHTAGSRSVRQGERLERVWRDMSMLHSHAGVSVFLANIANREFARSRFGVID